MKILFVCTGNSCRSPMAEALAGNIFARDRLFAEISSAGTSVLHALAASANAVAVMKTEYGLDISSHITRQVLRDDLVSADYVFTMTERHKDYLTLQAPDFRHKFHTIAQFVGCYHEDVTDPFGGDYECYRQCAEQMSLMIEGIVTKLKVEQADKIAVAGDHGGFMLKQEMMKHLNKRRVTYSDFGSYDDSPVDYPIYAKKVVQAILRGGYRRGLLICGTGIGISMAANRYLGIRAALCSDVYSAKVTRDHNDANILVMGGRVMDHSVAAEILDMFIDTSFSGDARHIRRVSMLDEIDIY